MKLYGQGTRHTNQTLKAHYSHLRRVSWSGVSVSGWISSMRGRVASIVASISRGRRRARSWWSLQIHCYQFWAMRKVDKDKTLQINIGGYNY